MLAAWMNALGLRLRTLFRRKQLDRDLEDEIAFHLAMKSSKAGRPEHARRDFGNITWFREACRELWGLGRIEIWWQDIRYGARLLRRSPAFTAVAVLSLALGIGANTLVFSLFNGVMLKPLAATRPDELREIAWTGHNVTLSYYHSSGSRMTLSGQALHSSFSYPIYREFRDSAAGFSDVMAFCVLPELSVVHRGEAFTSYGLIVSGNLFRGLGTRPLLGRTLAPEDDRPGAAPVAVVTYGWWDRYAGRNPGLLGQTVLLNGAGYTVVGILPREFSSPLAGSPVDIYVPMAAQPRILPHFPLASPKHWWVNILARLPKSADERQAQAAIQVLFSRLAAPEQSGQKIEHPEVLLESGASGATGVRGRLLEPMLLLMGVVALVLLIACANLAGLLLARGAARRHEMALRVAVGAARFRLIRHLLTESLLLSLAGGILAVGLASVGSQALLRMIAPLSEALVRFDFHTDARVLAFTLAASLVTALLAGLVPAVKAARQDPVSGLSDNAARSAPRLRLGKALVVAQVAMSLFLLAGAALLLRNLVSLWGVDPGFRTENLLVFRLNASTAGYRDQRLAEFYERARQSLAAIPGVRGVTLSDNPLLGGRYSSTGFSLPGRKARSSQDMQASLLHVGDSFLATMGISLLVGHDFGPADAPRTAIVNEVLARAHFTGESPVGRMLRIGDTDYQIIGVCKEAKYRSFGDTPPAIYLHYDQDPATLGAMYFELRTAVPPLSLARSVRRTVAALDTNVPLTALSTQVSLIEQSMLPYRILTFLCGSFAALALLLAGIGLYGVMAYSVTRRTAEIGVRMALGAARHQVLWMVLRESIVVTATGLAIGLPSAIAATAWARTVLFGIEWTDPAPLAGAVGLLLVVTATAALIPAIRASRVAPMSALQESL
ncbi:MAG TPA: ABC transporter permease [Bryobacteraceae bacterium]|nr:ABC transporter permease [Bryobacteraceae bacterium]